MTTRIPTDNERRLHVAIIMVAAVVATGAVGAAVWSLTRPQPVRVLPPSSLASVPKNSVSPSVSVSATSTEPTAAGVTPGSETTSSAGLSSETNTKVAVSAHKIAYRLNNAIYVAKEDAKGARPVYGRGSHYALSPDGVWMASIEGGKLAVVKVGVRPASDTDVDPGVAAEAVTPVWMPDSSAVLFVRSTGADMLSGIWRYEVSAPGVTKVGAGSGVAVSPDGKTVVGLPGDVTGLNVLTVWRSDESSYTIRLRSGDAIAVALANDRIFVSTDTQTSGEAGLWSLSLDGKQRTRLEAPASAGPTSATFGQLLLLSPDRKRLLYTVEGDDDYSRIRIVPVAGGNSTAISRSRDGYPLAWTADSKRVLFIEGNAFQGQTTALWRSDTDGRHRTQLVAHATL